MPAIRQAAMELVQAVKAARVALKQVIAVQGQGRMVQGVTAT
ncbi:MAG: hypothetical protein ACYCUV_03425 [Phycisphaerae bacterium]